MGKRILLIDENDSWRRLVADELIRQGHIVTISQYDSVSENFRLIYDLVVLGGGSFEAIRPIAEALGTIRMPYIAHTTITPLRAEYMRNLFVFNHASDVLPRVQSSGYIIDAILTYFNRRETEAPYLRFARENE